MNTSKSDTINIMNKRQLENLIKFEEDRILRWQRKLLEASFANNPGTELADHQSICRTNIARSEAKIVSLRSQIEDLDK